MDLHTCFAVSTLILFLGGWTAPVAATSPFDEGPLADDDAGSGRDAPDVAAAALPIDAEREHGGSLVAPDDGWDWYRIDASARFVHVVLRATTACLWLEQGGRPLAVACPTGGVVSLWSFTEPTLALDIGVERGGPGSYRLRVGLEDHAGGAADASPGFEADGRDAPDLPVPLAVLDDGAVSRGTVGTFLGDRGDWYAIDAPAGVRVTVMIHHVGAGCVRLTAEVQGKEPTTCMFGLDQGRSVLHGQGGDRPLYLGLGGWSLGYDLRVEW